MFLLSYFVLALQLAGLKKIETASKLSKHLYWLLLLEPCDFIQDEE